MTDKDRSRFEEIMDTAAQHYGREVSGFKRSYYFNCLQEMPIGDFESAVWTCMQYSDEFPTVPGIRFAAGPTTAEAAEKDAAQAWSQARTHGWEGRTSVALPSYTYAAIDECFGGWRAFCALDGGTVKQQDEFLRVLTRKVGERRSQLVGTARRAEAR